MPVPYRGPNTGETQAGVDRDPEGWYAGAEAIRQRGRKKPYPVDPVVLECRERARRRDVGEGVSSAEILGRLSERGSPELLEEVRAARERRLRREETAKPRAVEEAETPGPVPLGEVLNRLAAGEGEANRGDAETQNGVRESSHGMQSGEGDVGTV
jgi:hypothetical protein